MKLIHKINDKCENTYLNLDNIHKKNDKKYEFYLDNILNSIYITDRLIFQRKTDDYIFNLEIGNECSCFIELINEKKKFDIGVISANYKHTNNEIIIEYIIETEDENKHTIILEIGE